MEDPDIDLPERARYFWSRLDVDMVFDELLSFLISLRDNIKIKNASDKDYIQAMNIILEAEVTLSGALKNDTFEQVLISEDILTVSVSDTHCAFLKDGSMQEDELDEDCSRGSRNPESGSDNSQMSSYNRNNNASLEKVDQYDHVLLQSSPRFSPNDQMAPVSPIQVLYLEHDCSQACIPQLPPSMNHYLGQNPLRVPLLCKFQRQCAFHCSSVEQEDELQDSVEADVLYKAPCGRGLCCMDDVLQFLQQTESLGSLQPVNFSFNPEVLPDRESPPRLLGSAPSLSATILFERDISRGTEAVPVPLCNEVDGVRPKEFRYRKERWPHGCFLSAAPFFSACCDCADGCTDVKRCLCLQRSLKAGAAPKQLYDHQRLNEPVSTGLFECGPWCACEKSKCLNRVVQRGLRVRLQVFRTSDKGWGVRCRDDLDKGTFVCIYAGVVLSLEQSLEDTISSKNLKDDAASDDEVEVVEEWTLPTGQKTTVTETLDISPPLYVPVIKKPADQTSVVLDGEKEQLEQQDLQEEIKTSSPDSNKTEMKDQDDKKEEVVRKKPRLESKEKKGDTPHPDQAVPKGHVLKQGPQENMYYLDASKEGNVARFINHSCNPNLFVQNVFVDTHNPKFPLVAFFTCRSIKAGTELTWNYSYNPGSDPEHEVPCLCGYKNCQTILI
ncbi:histone-lysine N-methyltransferase SETDB2 [Astyanax mexicanus]|uniref:histone-lysine N-methyltransferase SETDB2 n=1 Tax=Astyanax mexicanus TaxID=7994 RepID=UPI0020CAB138|nr:histone-lysine N-methyltransferase SETDB2 [Astyanax mexicanus]